MQAVCQPTQITRLSSLKLNRKREKEETVSEVIFANEMSDSKSEFAQAF